MTSYRHTPILFMSTFGGFVFWLNTVGYISDLSDSCMRVTPDLLSLTYVLTNVFVRTGYLYCVMIVGTLMGEYFGFGLSDVETRVRGGKTHIPLPETFEPWVISWLEHMCSHQKKTEKTQDITELYD